MEELLTAEDVAKLWKMSASHVRHLARTGELPSIRLGIRDLIRFTRQDVETYVDNHRREVYRPNLSIDR